MQTITLNVKNEDVSDKILWLLRCLEGEGVEIVDKEDIQDLKLLAATRTEESIPFEAYLKNEDQHWEARHSGLKETSLVGSCTGKTATRNGEFNSLFFCKHSEWIPGCAGRLESF